ncbi:MAG: elongation factor EF-2, partial [Candidatus Diapherotrites archaeon]|nr:elongation factor EF-2 [Candidatus Diapherotrites archaeon]
MGRYEDAVAAAGKLMRTQKQIRNIGIAAHIDHGKTTLTDNLVAAAGLISTELAGKQLVMDWYELEQERGITINSANISVVYNFEGKDHLVNIIDTPGHVDFGGDVIRAMRAVDGVVIVACAVEGTMPQTETVVRQALRENVKPVLFINKVDRLLSELQVTPEEMQTRFVKIIADVNKLIAKNAPEQFKDAWLVKPENGSVAFGSAYKNWATSIPQMKKTGINFKQIYDLAQTDEGTKELAKKSPLYDVVNEMFIKHIPNPVDAQKYRVGKIWSGDIESDLGKQMLACDPDGKLMMMITNVSVDPQAREVITGRIFSGTIKKGMEIHLLDSKKTAKIQQVGIFMGPDRIPLGEVTAGNIGAIVGLKEGFSGETLSEDAGIEPFEGFMTQTEPVVVMAIEAKNMKDLPKLVEVMRSITKADPNVRVELNQDTGEHLVAGMGELHLEIVQHRIENDHGIPIATSPPIVIYNESVSKQSNTFLGKSPNKHNKFFFHTEPLEPEILAAIKAGDIKEGTEKNKDKIKERTAKLVELGMDRDVAKKVLDVYEGNMLIDATKGVQYLFETRSLVIQAFEEAMKQGPLAREHCRGVKVVLTDADLHEDSIHRGPAQVLPAIKRPIYACLLSSGVRLLEPKQNLSITIPQDYLGAVSTELQSRRANIEDMTMEGDQTT